MQVIAVYLNQKAANTSFKFWKERIGNALFRSKVLFRVPGDLQELQSYLQEDIQNKVDVVVSVGGDGTMNILIQLLSQTGIKLLVVPGGTANDLASELGTLHNIKKVIHTVREKDTVQIDLININGKKMATNGGLGLGALVAKRINDLRQHHPFFKNIMKLSGKRIYTLFMARELLSLGFSSSTFLIKSKDFTKVVDSSCILINNQPVLAGSFRVAPFTKNNDGQFNVTILTHKKRSELIQCILQVALGDYPHKDPNFITFETEEVMIENLSKERPMVFFGDGEVFDASSQWNIAIEKKALNVYSLRNDSSIVDVAHLSTDAGLEQTLDSGWASGALGADTKSAPKI